MVDYEGRLFLKMRRYLITILLIAASLLMSCGATPKYSRYNYSFTNQTGNGVYHSMEQKKKTTDKYEGYLENLSTLPVSFVYDGTPYNGIETGESGPFKEKSRKTTAQGSKVSTVVNLEFKDDIAVTLEMAIYPDYCAYEWVLYFENKGKSNTKVLEDLKCADMIFYGENPVLKGIYGDGGVANSGPYAPYEFVLEKCDTIHMTPETGRSTYNHFPYFNLQYGDGGTFAAIGWPITWGASFEYVYENSQDGLRFEAGQESISTYLEPGEKIRTPLMAMLDYEGRDDDRATNLWRHWFIECNMRQVDGGLFEPQISGCTSGMYGEMVLATDDNQIAGIQKYLDNNVPLSYWWMDAGWYFEYGDKSLDVWLPTGTWMVDTKRFPSKMKAISDYGAQRGVKTLLWFEPEVVRLQEELRDKENGIPAEYMLDGVLANFGNPDFVDWMIERVSTIITEGGISLYRQDYGINPLYNFNALNKEGRTGIIENLYAQGYYAYWDKLIERFPNMMIDSCAAGGGRNDIESMRRSVPLHKTDHDYSNQEHKQSMHQALYAWLPYFGTNLTGNTVDPYIMRSNITPWINLNVNINSKLLKWETVSTYTQEWTVINKYYYDDYYQLTEWSRDKTGWKGWEFFSPSEDAGFIQMFRPDDAPEDIYKIKLKGLDASATYAIRNVDTGIVTTATGQSLMQDGIDVELSPRSTALFTITKA